MLKGNLELHRVEDLLVKTLDLSLEYAEMFGDDAADKVFSPVTQSLSEKHAEVIEAAGGFPFPLPKFTS